MPLNLIVDNISNHRILIILPTRQVCAADQDPSIPPINLHFVSAGATWDGEEGEEGEEGEGHGEVEVGTEEAGGALSLISLEEQRVSDGGDASRTPSAEEEDTEVEGQEDDEGDEGEDEDDGGVGLVLQMKGPLPRLTSDSATLVYADDACAPRLVHV